MLAVFLPGSKTVVNVIIHSDMFSGGSLFDKPIFYAISFKHVGKNNYVVSRC